MLIVFGGLPATGKSTLSLAFARELKAVHVRIDTIEAALQAALPKGKSIDDWGYRVAYVIAEDNLRLGRIVIADSVNPIALTREAWLNVARRAGVRAVEVEIVCSNRTEHRRRVETRASDIAGHKLPDWNDVVARHYETWTRPHIVIDTAGNSVAQSVTALHEALAGARA